MIWRRLRGQSPHHDGPCDRAEAERSRAEAERELHRARRQSPVVDRAVDRMLNHGDEDYFTALIQQAFERRQR